MRFLIFFITVALPVIINGQMSAPGSKTFRYTKYSSGPNDKIFIYCNSSGSQKGTLQAVSPGGTAPFTYTWYRWNNTTKAFSDLLRTDSSVPSSTVTDLPEGGYRVEISDGGAYNATLTGWIFLDKPRAQASLQNRTCDYVALKGVAAVDTFFYYNPSDGTPVRLPNGVRFLWSSDPASSIPYPDYELNPQTFSPPLKDVTYKLTVTDSMTCISESSFFYESIHVKAEFTPDPVNGEAPLEVKFTNKSVRGFQYTWEFGDDSTFVQYDTVGHSHVYYKPGEYSVKLSLVSDRGCEDSIRYDKIVVEKSSINIPNVFTPDGDGYNDWFMIDIKSMKSVSMQVFSRSGLKVYGFNGEGEKLKGWQGWDGTINNTSIKASPGIYFYLIRAYGWDNVIWDGKDYRGFVYLYR